MNNSYTWTCSACKSDSVYIYLYISFMNSWFGSFYLFMSTDNEYNYLSVKNNSYTCICATCKSDSVNIYQHILLDEFMIWIFYLVLSIDNEYKYSSV